MIKPDWGIFKAKFSENPQSNFEWFCYLLFCKKFERPDGIHRYKNQSAIETDPIKIGDAVIGFQAKFYDSTLSNHKREILDTIHKAKRDYSDITKLIFYTNQEWGQNTDTGKPSKAKREIEKEATERGIEIEWKTASFFESEFVSVENEIFSKYFFTSYKSFFDVQTELQKHTENILNQIKTNISFNDKSFEVDRTKILDKLKDDTQQILILSGVGGVGKTALIKNLYKELKEDTPFYLFKGTEFELRAIDDMLRGFSFHEFFTLHKDIKSKIIVIDSAEKLLDLKNPDPLKEFISALIPDNWKIIFTTRGNYLENLNYQFFEIYNIAPLNINVDNLELDDLYRISHKHLFSLPKDEKLLEFIRNPFHLNEYLKLHNHTEEIQYREFKARLWNQNIRKTNPEREKGFLKLAFERATKGNFLLESDYHPPILKELVSDGILGYEFGCYFIAHDIYEEWALEKIIESQFIRKHSIQDFFSKIGHSLPIRRSFRNWLSEKLLLNHNTITTFIIEIITDEKVVSFWKDETLVSILLSNYSEVFFGNFKDNLLSDEQELLKKITSLLRIACKEIDSELFKQSDIKSPNLFSLKYILTKPRGQGWQSLIAFVFDNIESIGINNIDFILPVIHDWNRNTKKGKTTKFSSLIALKYYEEVINQNFRHYYDHFEKRLIETILHGALEIKNLLKDIFEKILQHGWKNYRDPYSGFLKMMLTEIEGFNVCKIFPDYSLKLANLYWTRSEGRVDEPQSEQYFGIESTGLEYFPASAFQTPIYILLRSHYEKTIDFILDFTNKSVQSYANSGFDKSLEEVKVFISDGIEQKQYISSCLWNMYRGTGSPASPYLLQSIHMALERHLLEIGGESAPDVLESQLIYLLQNSNSASISSIVTSVVLAYPEKTFNVAEILFQIKEFIINDTQRQLSEQNLKSSYLSLYSFGASMVNDVTKKDFFDERIIACEDQHRNLSLEILFLNYQYFRTSETSDDEAERRQQILWQILDAYYEKLPPETEQVESDKIWRFFLARMDGRRMTMDTKKTDEGIEMHFFNPELPPDLQEDMTNLLEKASNLNSVKYTQLKTWAEYKFKEDERAKQYKQYENSPQLVLNETRKLVETLQKGEDSTNSLCRTIPAYACSILLRDYLKDTTPADKTFCKDTIFETSLSYIFSNRLSRMIDEMPSPIFTLPALFGVFPEEREKIQLILLISLSNCSLYEYEHTFVSDIQHMWKSMFDEDQSLLLGYLLFKPKYDEVGRMIREKNYAKHNPDLSHTQLLEIFRENSKEELRYIAENSFSLFSLNICRDIREYDLPSLKVAFELIPQKTNDEDYKIIAKTIISIFAKKMASDNSEDGIIHKRNHEYDFLRAYAHFVLNSPKNKIQDYLQPFLEHFSGSKFVAHLFQELILAEERLKKYDNFWIVWNYFKDKVLEICERDDSYRYLDEVLQSYLFAETPWEENAREWHSLKEQGKQFFWEVTNRKNRCFSTILYAISKLLNGIGSNFLDDGMFWISNIIKNNNNDLSIREANPNTIYYMEKICTQYVFNKGHEFIKKDQSAKNSLLLILDYLIQNGSSIGYMLRENII